MALEIAFKKKQAKKQVYSTQDLSLIKQLQFPEHVAIIMDGNRRWAKQRGLPVYVGHWRGASALFKIVRLACECGIKVLTVYAFSTENWQRSEKEIRELMYILKTYLLSQRQSMCESGIRLNVIGDLAKFPKDVQSVLDETLSATHEGKKLDLVIALNYGSRDEIKRAICKITEDCIDKKIQKEDICEQLVSRYLDTGKWKDPELLIRAGGESRVSNFLLWQISYAEVLVTNTLWPDFCEKDFLEAMVEYQKRESRIGK